jgi:hypothetical protein
LKEPLKGKPLSAEPTEPAANLIENLWKCWQKSQQRKGWVPVHSLWILRRSWKSRPGLLMELALTWFLLVPRQSHANWVWVQGLSLFPHICG